MEGKGSGKERKGKEGRGPGREGEPVVGPSAFPAEAGVSAPKDEGGNGKATPSSKGSPDFRQAAVCDARARIERGEWTKKKAIERLAFFGLSEDEANTELGEGKAAP